MSDPANSASRSLLRYCLVGAGNFGLSLGLTAFLHEILGAPEELAFGVTLVTLFVINFFVSRHYVYQASDGSARRQFGRFLVSAASFRALEYGAFLLVHTVLGVYYLAAVVAVQVTSFFGKFLFYRAFVFVGGRHPEPIDGRHPEPMGGRRPETSGDEAAARPDPGRQSSTPSTLPGR